MGRYYYDKKDTVEDCRSVSISFLRKHDYLSENSCRSGGISWKNFYGEETNSIGIVVSTFEDDKYVRFYYSGHKSNAGHGGAGQQERSEGCILLKEKQGYWENTL